MWQFGWVSGVLLGVCGSIAAYKAVEVLRGLSAAGLQVQVCLTEGATRFVSSLTFEALSGRLVVEDWDRSSTGIDHVEMGYAIEAAVVAPITAHTLARLAHGWADCPLTATLLSVRAPLVVAPAMESRMWEHPATQANVRLLRERGALFVGPEAGPLASGRHGVGRMAEPAAVVAAVQALRNRSNRRWLLTAGPTWEPLDPVRLLTNRATGTLGVALADAAASQGIQVDLVLGPTPIRPTHPGVQVVSVETAQEMDAAVQARLQGAEVFVATAAVSDFRPAHRHPNKLKRSHPGADHLALVENPDILAQAARSDHRPPLVVGFAAETDAVTDHAVDKRRRKGADAMVANLVGPGQGFGTGPTELFWMDDEGTVSSGPVSKTEASFFLLDRIFHRIRGESR